MDEARAAVSEMLGLVGDRYTRYVPPGEYKALLARYEDLWRARIDRLDDLLAEPSDPSASITTKGN